MKTQNFIMTCIGLFLTPFIIGGIFYMFGINKYDSVIFVIVGTVIILLTVITFISKSTKRFEEKQ